MSPRMAPDPKDKPPPVPPDRPRKPPVETPPDQPGIPPGEPDPRPKGDPPPNEPTRLVLPPCRSLGGTPRSLLVAGGYNARPCRSALPTSRRRSYAAT